MHKQILTLNVFLSFLITHNNFIPSNYIMVENNQHIKQMIEGGEQIKSGEYAAFNYLSYQKLDNSQPTILGCGTLIDSEWILTAAHVAKYYEDHAREGEKLLATFNNTPTTKTVSIDQIIYHPNFHENTIIQNASAVDLALLHLTNAQYEINVMKLHHDVNYKFGTTEVTVLGQSHTNDVIKNQKLKIFRLDNRDAEKWFGASLFHQPLYSEKNDFFLSKIMDRRQFIESGDSGGAVIKIIDNIPHLIGVVKGSPQSIADPAPIFIATSVTKQYHWIVETIYNNDHHIIHTYQENNYAAIFNSPDNPRINTFNRQFHRISGSYTGNPLASTNTRLSLMFDRSYSYLIYQFITENDKFINKLNFWISNNNLTENLKMKILLHFIQKSLHVKSKLFINKLNNNFKNNDFLNFITNFNDFFTWENNHYKKIIGSSLANKIRSMKKDVNSKWINAVIRNHQQAIHKNQNILYDGGIGYFLYFNIHHPQKFAWVLKNASHLKASNKQIDSGFYEEKELIISKIENQNVTLSFVNRKKQIVEYEFNNI